MAMTYTQWLAANRLRPTAQAAQQWLATAAPPGTAIPASLQSAFGGATRTGQAPAAAAPAAPAAPVYTPPDPTKSDPTLESIAAQIAGLPGLYNPQRAIAAAQTAAQLADYSDTPITSTAVAAPGGDTAYQLKLGADGRLYREGAASDIYGAASTGDVGSSGLANALADTHRNLDLQAQQILQGWYGQQQQSLADEMAQRAQLGSDWATGLSNWQQNQTQIAGSAGSPQGFHQALTGFLQPTTTQAQPTKAPAAPLTWQQSLRQTPGNVFTTYPGTRTPRTSGSFGASWGRT